MKFKNIFNLIFISSLALVAPVVNAEESNEAVDFCNIEEHDSSISPKTEFGEVVSTIGDFSYEYRISRCDEDSFANFYADGSFYCNFSECDIDTFSCSSGLSFNSGNTHEKIGHLYADFKVIKPDNFAYIDYSYVGVHSWSNDHLIEYAIIDTWLGDQLSVNWFGQYFGDIMIDGAEYSVYKNVNIAEDVTQVFSIRKIPRDCGTIDITAHFKKWEKIEDLDIKIGEVHDAKIIFKAKSNDYYNGAIDFPYAKVYVKPNKRKCIIWNQKN